MADLSLSLARTLATWRRRSRERRELQALDDRTLRDLGVSVQEIRFEAAKPFWRD
jgi:uncharacterized protein YjiS (DUF1127 family)